MAQIVNRIKIKDEGGRIIGFIEEQDNGDKIAKDFYGRILGKYHKDTNKTHDFWGRIVGKGDVASGLIWENNAKNEREKSKNNK